MQHDDPDPEEATAEIHAKDSIGDHTKYKVPDPKRALTQIHSKEIAENHTKYKPPDWMACFQLR